MTKRRTQTELARDAKLSGESLRVLQRAYAVFGVEELTEQTALEAAKNVRQKLAAMPRDVRLCKQRDILALMDDVNHLRDNLRAEQIRVEKQIKQQTHNKRANIAYMVGETSCPSR
jgi:D-alanyl-D-alanine carboxypeptidase